ncbi:aconitase family protein [Streptomyces sp. fd1-xmd]|uniref:LeuD/DmdB family oxidoreductase small subunit n=1 Tax=Streptomyces sp. fd1-xmd TaxID=1812480 RepID=UPI00099062E7|nr:aconitase family protein [Streptomyces sp. fd1-xmd]
MTLVRQLFEHKLGRPVSTGEVVDLPFDLCWGSEMTVKWALDILRDSGFDDEYVAAGLAAQRERTAFVFDHVVPTHTASMASILVELRRFAREHGIRVFDVGYDGGIQHKILIEQGLIRPGDVAVGADSHSCTAGAIGSLATGIGSTDLAMALVRGSCWMRVPEAALVRFHGSLRPHVQGKDVALYLCGLIGVHGAVYRSLEFGGPGLASLAITDRLSLSNMAVEMGAKYGLFPTDGVLADYLGADVDHPDFTVDEDDAEYVDVIDVDLGSIEPTVALPFSPDNAVGTHQLQHLLRNWGEYEGREDLMTGVAPLARRANGNGEIPVDQVFIGSCTNGHLEDLRVVADVLRGRRVHEGVRTIVIPASQKAYRAAMKEGLIDVLIEAGCYVESSSCGPCIGIKSGVLGKGEVAVFTSNRNFRGRCGDVDASVVLASPAIAARAALTGVLAPIGDRSDYYADEDAVRRGIEELFALHSAREGRAALPDSEDRLPATAAPDTAGRDAHAEGGSLAWVFGDHVNTDVILPGVFCQIPDPAEYKKHIMAHAGNQAFLDHYAGTGHDLTGSVIVGGANFGCGSSRENAPMGIKASGAPFVVAHSFARIFFRNALNIGLRLVEVGDFAHGIREGDRLVVDDERGELVNVTRGTSAPITPPSAFERELLTAGGLVAYTGARVRAQAAAV